MTQLAAWRNVTPSWIKA